jgi:hypothetical protein
MPPHTSDGSIVTTQTSTTLNVKEEKTSPSAPGLAVFGYEERTAIIYASTTRAIQALFRTSSHPDNGRVYDTVKALKGRRGGRLIGA